MLTDKVALVTGGNGGIGRAYIDNLLQNGAKVVICDKNQDKIEELISSIEGTYGTDRACFLECDVTDQEIFEGCFKKALEKFKKLDIVINNAGIVDEKDPGWSRTVQINLMGVIGGTHLAMRYMSKENGGEGGVVVNTSSTTSLVQMPPIPVYASTKAAINHFSRSMGSDLYFNRTGVKVMAILPGLTETPLIHTPVQDLYINDETATTAKTVMAHSNPQSADTVGKALISILETDENGSLWVVDQDKPPTRITQSFTFE